MVNEIISVLKHDKDIDFNQSHPNVFKVSFDKEIVLQEIGEKVLLTLNKMIDSKEQRWEEAFRISFKNPTDVLFFVRSLKTFDIVSVTINR
jgi:hypothetical protein